MGAGGQPAPGHSQPVATPQPPGATVTTLHAVAATPAGSTWAVGLFEGGGPPTMPYAIHCC
jgi:hypothetical protein